VDAGSGSAPTGVRDSKLLAPAAREALVPRLLRWAVASAVASAGPDEVDAYGIVAALRLAGERALAALGVAPDVVLLDGSHDWLTRPDVQPDLFAGLGPDLDDPVAGPSAGARVAAAYDRALAEGLAPAPRVVTRIKADLACSSVAAASVLAKVARDGHMTALAPRHAAYRWEVNKGYATEDHRDALRRYGPCGEHRRTWALLGDPAGGAEPAEGRGS
jgi:ribonuclease HII